ncbi:MAG TPA: RNA 2',3'-cyclic phosphodiesterase [Dehalococcoidia bacterium]|nr:RNA 2',3'-cyclic phosphodiesterase [Dehalococcoidia bacterium]
MIAKPKLAPTGRLFLALPLPPQLIAALTAAHDEFLAAGVPRLRWVHPNRLHLTVQFLGETPLSQVSAIEEALKEAASETPALTLTLNGWGLFEGRSRGQRSGRSPRVLWAGLGGDTPGLAACVDRLEQALAARGLPSDPGRFRPHITLARVPERAPLPERTLLREIVAGMPPPPDVAFQAAEVALIQSVLGSPPRYQTLRRAPFRGA